MNQEILEEENNPWLIHYENGRTVFIQSESIFSVWSVPEKVCEKNMTWHHTECLMSSKVAEKESMSWWGSCDKKPMVSTYSTVMWLGSWPACTVTSKVAKSWFLGWRPLSPVRALINVVFPAHTTRRRGSAKTLRICVVLADAHHSWCIPAPIRRGTPCASSGTGGGASFYEVFPVPSESLPPAPSAASAGPRTAFLLEDKSEPSPFFVQQQQAAFPL